jgi:hypothetical protein
LAPCALFDREFSHVAAHQLVNPSLSFPKLPSKTFIALMKSWAAAPRDLHFLAMIW